MYNSIQQCTNSVSYFILLLLKKKKELAIKMNCHCPISNIEVRW